MNKAKQKSLMEEVFSEVLEIYSDKSNICSVACEMVYENDDGGMCAVGRYLKPDARKNWTSRKYDSILGEGKNCVINKISEATIRSSFKKGGYGELPLEFWNNIQKVHDNRLEKRFVAECKKFIDGFGAPVKKKRVAKKRKVRKTTGNKLL